MIGRTLAHYRVTEQIGAGGMGEVYRAHDTKLGRDVALKTLPESFATDAERLSRFEREAKLLAGLNHRSIGAIYGLEQAEDQRFLILELVEGVDLAKRLSEGPLSIEDALPIAYQICEALEAAHEQSVVHRDLKPANVVVSPDGTVKVLDFGLAKALEVEGAPDNLSHSPTALGSSPTIQGVILGTAAYMSPEQARGKPVDRRADIFAFGCVLYELLTGKQCFTGETVSDTLASVLAREPDWDAVPANTPFAIQRLLRRCLDKNPLRRLRDIGEARIIIEDVMAGKDDAPTAETAAGEAEATAKPWRSAPMWVMGGIALLAITAATFFGAKYMQAPGDVPQVIRAFVPAPEETSFSLSALHPGAAVISPDGTKIAFSARNADGNVLLYVREIDEVAGRPLPGTTGAGYPFWSPDSKHIGFVADGKLKRVDAGGGPPLTLCDAQVGKGGTWSRDDVILFAPSFNTPIHRVPAAGGDSEPVTELQTSAGENSHRHPYFLPNGHHFLYFARGGGASSGEAGNKIVLASLDGDEPRVLVDSRSHAIYAEGHILFIRETSLMARPFDVKKLEFTGNAFPVVEQVKYIPGAFRGVFSASDNGTLLYQTGEGDANNQLAWIDREGNEISVVANDATFSDPALSPDDRSIALEILDSRAGSWDLWTYDVARGIRTRFTFDATNDTEPHWSPDGTHIVFSASREGRPDLYVKPFGGSAAEEPLLVNERPKFATDWSPDGKYMAFSEVSDSTQSDIWILPVDGGESFPLIKSPFAEFNGRFSPDGRWLAYASSESGRTEVYVSPFPGPGRKWQVSSNGGNDPQWRRDGRELFYAATSEQMVAVEISYGDDEIILGQETTLFDYRAGSNYDVTADGQRFIVTKSVLDDDSTPLTLIINWDAELAMDR